MNEIDFYIDMIKEIMIEKSSDSYEERAKRCLECIRKLIEITK